MSKTQEIIKLLNLEKHPLEGGYYKRTYTSKFKSFFSGLGEERFLASAIYYLFDENLVSRPHSLKQDEIWHFYSGSQIEVLLIYPDNISEIVTMGSDILRGDIPQLIIPAGSIFSAKLKKGGDYALIGASLSPAFDYEDYQDGDILDLINKFPQHGDFLKSCLPRREAKYEKTL
jgi:predicted cupin superfamily sugar epimerase